jgi:hypothetical protein
MLIHQPPRPLKLLSRQVGSVFEDFPHPFVVDLFCPLGTDQPMHREPHHEAAQASRVQHACIQHDDGTIGIHSPRLSRCPSAASSSNTLILAAFSRA